ncbi:MAG: YcxB family protein [Candidatus Symbiothrix sp.]|jgi:hypothetical protein|nr:YcxB family protein [Candidatus Symbiothrix sp.]
MKKLSGWLWIIFCSILVLIFLIGFIILVTDDRMNLLSVKEILNLLIVFVVVVFLSIIGIISKIKEVKEDKPIEIIEYSGELNINFTGRIAYKDYKNFILKSSLKRPLNLFFIGIMIIIISGFLLNENPETNQSNSIFIIPLILCGIFLYTPILTLTQAKKIYKINKIFQEQLNYSLNNESIRIKGDEIDTTQKWTRYYKIKETKEFFILYQDKIVANFLDKKLFTDDELIEFRKFIQSLDVIRE